MVSSLLLFFGIFGFAYYGVGSGVLVVGMGRAGSRGG